MTHLEVILSKNCIRFRIYSVTNKYINSSKALWELFTNIKFIQFCNQKFMTARAKRLRKIRQYSPCKLLLISFIFIITVLLLVINEHLPIFKQLWKIIGLKFFLKKLNNRGKILEGVQVLAIFLSLFVILKIHIIC